MARRKQSGLANDLIELVSRLPWGVGVALAALSYVLLHRIASQPPAVVPQPGHMTSILTQAVWHGFAVFGQYAAPFICLIGAALSAWRRKQRKSLVANTVQSQASDALDGMSWREFEMLVGEGFRLQGYQVVETGGGGADGGIDLVLSKPGRNGTEKYLVQCKQWRAFKVGVDVVRELYGVMAAKGAAGGFVVTSGRFTEEAAAFASGRNVQLIDGPKLRGLLAQAQARAAGSTTRSATVKEQLESIDKEPPSPCSAPVAPSRWSAAPPSEAPAQATSSGAARVTRPVAAHDPSGDRRRGWLRPQPPNDEPNWRNSLISADVPAYEHPDVALVDD